MILPSFDGVRPRSDSWIAFSIWRHRARVERLDRQHARLGDVDRRELLQRRVLPVVVDRDSVEQCRRRAARADGVELGARVLDRLVHSAYAVLDQLVDVVTLPPSRSR